MTQLALSHLPDVQRVILHKIHGKAVPRNFRIRLPDPFRLLDTWECSSWVRCCSMDRRDQNLGATISGMRKIIVKMSNMVQTMLAV